MTRGPIERECDGTVSGRGFSFLFLGAALNTRAGEERSRYSGGFVVVMRFGAP
ncbi:hypothetical protein TorRG33x02_206500, partial [Trema orientale]